MPSINDLKKLFNMFIASIVFRSNLSNFDIQQMTDVLVARSKFPGECTPSLLVYLINNVFTMHYLLFLLIRRKWDNFD